VVVVTSGRAGQRVIVRLALAGAFLAAVACAGCAAQPDPPPRATVQTCIRFGVRAIHRRVVVRTLPPACRGLSRAQVNFAVASAVRQSAGHVRGKANQRRRVARLSRYLAHLVTSVPPARAAPPPPPAPATRQVSNGVLGILALCSWLLTVGLGSFMMSRWISRRVVRQAFRRPAAPDAGLSAWVNFTHFGLAVAGLLTWIAYLVTGTTVVGWIACGALLPTAGFGMSLLFLGSGRRPALVVAAHISLAAATMLLTVLTVVNPTAAGG
jgi:hypothetical protein